MLYNFLVIQFSNTSYLVCLEQIICFALISYTIIFLLLVFLKNVKILQILRLFISFTFLGLFLLIFCFSSNWLQLYSYQSEQFNFVSFFFFDRLSLLFVLMSIFVLTLCYVYIFRFISLAIKPNLILVSLTEILVVLCFSVRNLLSFYVFFELILFPITILILQYGSRGRRVFASFNFFIYTFLGSLFIIIGIFFTFTFFNTLNFDDFINFSINDLNCSSTVLSVVFFLFWIGFSIKLPTIPLHLWLPEAHVEAPTVGSVILAAILLKLGGYGMIRIVLPIFQNTALSVRIIPFVFCIISVFYASFSAYRQFDLKKIIAYSSIVHMNFAALAFLVESKIGLIGCILSLLCHSLVSSGLFFSAGFLYDKYKTRNVLYYSSLFKQYNYIYVFFFIFIIANMAFPLTVSFVGETLILCGFVLNFFILLIISVFSLFFSGLFCFMLIYRLVYFNKISNTKILEFSLKNKIYVSPFSVNNGVAFTSSEFIILASLCFMIVFFFFFNDLFINCVSNFVFFL